MALKVAMSPPSGTRLGARFRLLLAGLVLCRGLVLLCVIPPFEGWDEYQHVGHVMHYSETGEPAVLGVARVPTSLIPAVVEFPQSRNALEQIRTFGAVDYASFWATDGPRLHRPDRSPRPAAEMGLYQAQHGSLYYRLAAPLFAAGGGAGDLRWSVGCLRLGNLILIVAAVWVALETVARLVPDERTAALIGLLIAAQPLFLINGLRVANDSLGVFLATLAIAGSLTLQRRGLLWKSALIGLATGFAVLAKAVHFGLLPFVGVCWLAVVWRDRIPLGRAALAGVLIAASFLAVVQVELRSNFARYGALTSTQEVLKNAREGRTRTDLLEAAGRVRWSRQLGQLWISDNLCIGGWSFLRPSRKLTRHYVQATVLGLVGWLWVVSARTRRASPLFRSPWTVPACAILCLSYTAALSYHMVHSQLAWGFPTTNPWYAAAALPWFLMLVAGGAMCWPLGRLRSALPASLAGIFLTAEAVMTWGQMATTYTGGAGGWLALRRLASLQPAFLGTATLLVATAGVLLAFATAAVRCGEAWLRPEESPTRSAAIYQPHLFDIPERAWRRGLSGLRSASKERSEHP